MTELAEAVQRLDVHLGARRRAAAPSPGWRGELSSSALSTATAMMALHGVDAAVHEERIQKGARWLLRTQNADGGWGDTEVIRSNLSTTLLVWASLHRCAAAMSEAAQQRAADWVRQRAGGSGPNEVAAAVVARYGKDRTFSVPILMHCTLGGILGEARSAWRRVLALPFELAALPRAWFGRLSLPVVSYALPALIAIGYARFHQAPPAWWNPLRWLRAALWPRIRPLLAELQPSSGGYLEATPLTSFVTMALAAAGQKDHPCVAPAVAFLLASMRENPADPDAGASWPIDTDLATWATTLSIKAGVTLQEDEATAVRDWLLDQQYAEVHPFTMAAPGGWAWTELPGGVPDADDTPGAMLALHRLDADLPRVREAAARGARWLLDLQNRDGGMPTFCRGWGTLPFDRSTPELTAHALAAWWCWRASFDDDLRHRVDAATSRAL
ncbi:MAG: hypothetical protein KDK99_18125, partial [Verrucomicrobiales bacterium]|nr:hypothetical protein [Verrucomicrobiales bacterium]